VFHNPRLVAESPLSLSNSGLNIEIRQHIRRARLTKTHHFAGLSSPKILPHDQHRTKKQTKTNTKTRTPRLVGGAPTRGRPGSGLSECSSLYLQALTNPFSITKPVCYPGPFGKSTYKFKSTVRGEMVIGTLGFGAVSLHPFHGCTYDLNTGASFGSDARFVYPFVRATTSLYDRTDFMIVNYPSMDTDPGIAAAGMITPFPGKTSEFPVARFTDPKLYTALRLVASGVRVQTTGKSIDRSGAYTVWRNSNPIGSLPEDADTESDILRFDTAQRFRVDAQWHGLTYRPVLESDTAVSTLSAFTGPVESMGTQDSSVVNRLAGVIAVEGAVPGTTFIFEAVAYYELISPGLQMTPSHGDPIGVAAVHAAMDTTIHSTNMEASQKDTSAAAARLLNTATSTSSKIVQAAGSAVKAATQAAVTAAKGEVKAQLRDRAVAVAKNTGKWMVKAAANKMLGGSGF